MLSCVNSESDIKYAQFTSDDLSYLYYNSNTLLFNGRTINYVDTIGFMLNGSERIRVPIVTKIDTFRNPPWNYYNEAGIQGKSSLILNKETGFQYATVYISRQYFDDSSSEKTFYIQANGVNPFEKQIFQADNIHLDTAFILGVHYENVLKFEPDILFRSNIKSIYFAKGFGFIKIETIDGKTMERILPSILGY